MKTTPNYHSYYFLLTFISGNPLFAQVKINQNYMYSVRCWWILSDGKRRV